MTAVQLNRAADIYRAMNGDKVPQNWITIAEVQRFIPAATFERFIEVNNIKIYEVFPK